MTQNTTIEIPADLIPDFGQVATEVKGLHEQFPDVDERAVALQGLMDKVGTNPADGSKETATITELALDRITDPTQEDEGTSLRRSLYGGKPKGDGLQLEVDDSGSIVGAQVIKRLPEDKSATARGHQIVAKTPSGPKMNDTSFRVNKT